MRRTQLYLEEEVWKLLEILARQSRSSVSDLVRRAIREKYVQRSERRGDVFRSAVGLWKDRSDLPDTETYVRSLRKNSRWQRMRG